MKKIVVVLGMHRSGTSALTRGIIELGAFPGNNLYQHRESNELGHFENNEIININEMMLSDLDYSWHSIDKFFVDTIGNTIEVLNTKYFRRARMIIENLLNQSGFIVIKEPRVMILLPFWIQVFSDFEPEVEVQYVYIHRNYEDVLRSLIKRDGYTSDYAENMILLYNYSMFKYLNQNFYAVCYANLLDEPYSVLQGLSKFLSVDEIIDKIALKTFSETFFDKRLDHSKESKSTPKEFKNDKLITILNTLVADINANNSVITLDKIHTTNKEITKLLETHLFLTDDFVLYFSPDLNFIEEKKKFKTYQTKTRNTIRFFLENDNFIKNLRLDLSSNISFISIYSIKINNNYIDLRNLKGNFVSRNKNSFIFTTRDPQFYIYDYFEIIHEIEVDFITENKKIDFFAKTLSDNYNELNSVAKELKNNLVLYEQVNNNNKKEINELNNNLNLQESIVIACREEIESKNQEIKNKDQELVSKGQEIESKNQEIENKNQEIENKNQEITSIVINYAKDKSDFVKQLMSNTRKKKGLLDKIRKWKVSYYIFKSKKFDSNYYLNNYDSLYKFDNSRFTKWRNSKLEFLKLLSKSINHPIRHYVWHGVYDGLNPTQLFDTLYYLECNPDVLVKGINPFYHYIKYGVFEKRNGAVRPLDERSITDYKKIMESNLFDPEYYLNRNIDVRAARIDPLTHFCSLGWREGRNPSASFDIQFYLNKYTDVRDAKINPLVHYIDLGRNENRETIKVNNLKGDKTIVFVGHEAERTGAPIVLLDLIKWFNNSTEYNVKVILLRGGEVQNKYFEVAETLVLDNNFDQDTINDFIPYNSVVLLNTIVAFRIFDSLYDNKNYKILTYIHELEKTLQVFPAELELLKENAEVVIGASEAVTINLQINHGVNPRVIEPVYAFIEPLNIMKTDNEKFIFKKQENIPTTSKVVVSCGTVYYRKNPKGFITVAEKVLSKNPDFYFVWIGNGEERAECIELIKKKNLSGKIRFIGTLENPREYFSNCDIFLLPAIEDPFPLVCLEAAECSLPIICFDEAGGMPTFVEDDCGIVAPFLDYDEMASAVLKMSDNILAKELGKNAKEKVLARHTVNKAAQQIKKIIDSESKKNPLISVIVPNYNYEKYLVQRLDSIYNQSFKDIEVILLDDSSTDNSIELLDLYRNKFPEITKTIYNSENVGNVFEQWKKGLEQARGKYIWIAEADDYASEDFLRSVLAPCMNDEDIVLSYSNSSVIGSNNEFYNTYDNVPWLTDIDLSKWKNDYVILGKDEINKALAIRCTIPNVSATLIKGDVIYKSLTKSLDFVKAGDWIFYLNIARLGKISYVSKPLNYHRRHNQTVTSSKGDELGIIEINKVHKYVSDTFILENKTKLNMVDLVRKEFEIYQQRGSVNLSFEKLYDESSILSNNVTKDKSVALYMKGLNFGKGGAEKILIRKANLIYENGVNVVVINRTNINSELPYKLNPNIDVIHITETEKVSDILKNRSISHCIVFGIGHDDLNVIQDLKENEIKTIYSMHNCVEFFDSSPGYKIHMKSIELSDNVSVITDNFKDEYIKRNVDEKKIIVVPNMVTKPDSKEPELNFLRDRKYIITVGRLTEQKQQRLLIEAFSIIKDEIEEYDLIIAGSGSLENELKTLVESIGLEDRVVFLGSVDNIGYYMSNCEFQVIPSKFEGFCLVLFEAASFGKLSIVFEECPPFSELFNEDSGIVMVNKMNAISLSEAILFTLKNGLQEKNYDKMLELFNKYEENTIIKKWIDILEETF
ncbi:glycosyltransferase [Paenibacillus frigoriresistens]|uniref:glycosyltransferase n=1 Tax=Paenibacillus alginolyticus TaxID=59839 RepID=UPI001566E8F8|nr:glycosyltransferase [Paenibacillus frigoriresistens]NRF95752.1 glycosyltransferase [Paenibacillus frigoriresistens]